MKTYVSAILTIAAFAVTCSTSFADQHVSVVAVSNAPIEVTNCNSGGEQRYTNVFNRTSDTLKSFTETWTAFASSGKKLGLAEDIEYDIHPPLASGDSGAYVQEVPDAAFTSGSSSPIARYSCVISEATFTNGSHWASGKSWHGQLLPLASAGSGESGASRSAGSGSSSGRLKFTVVKAWNDFSPGQYVVHDALMISGGNSPVTISADEFVLSVTLANGGVQQYTGLTKAAPTFNRFNYITKQPVEAPEVDPREDLGALGSLIVPPHGTVMITVSFILAAPLAEPDANRDVTMP